MKKLLILFGILLMFGCKKEEEVKPSTSVKPIKYCDWTLVVTGSDSTTFSVNFFSTVTPYIWVPYQAHCNVSPIKIHMIVGQSYGVQYRDIDSVVKSISYNPMDTIPVNDTIPGTIL